MSDIQPLNRQIEVLIGPLAEWQGGGDERIAVKVKADGTPDGLRIKFNIPKHIISTASPTIVSIYNLGAGLRGTLQKTGAQVIIRAGWSNVGLVEVFRGSLLASVNQRQGPDIVTDLMCLSGFASTSRTVLAWAFAGGTNLTSIVTDLAAAIPGISVDPKAIKIKDVNVGTQGSSFAGPVNEYLDKLARVHGFSWWINNSVFYALDDEQSFSSGIVSISANNGFLLRAEPMLASPMQIRAGTTINSLFNPYVQPGNLVELKTVINSQLNGLYKVHSMTHGGDSHSNEWTTGIESWITVV